MADVPESLPLSPSLPSCGGLAIAAARNLGRVGESEDTHQVTNMREGIAEFVSERLIVGQRNGLFALSMVLRDGGSC